MPVPSFDISVADKRVDICIFYSRFGQRSENVVIEHPLEHVKERGIAVCPVHLTCPERHCNAGAGLKVSIRRKLVLIPESLLVLQCTDTAGDVHLCFGNVLPEPKVRIKKLLFSRFVCDRRHSGIDKRGSDRVTDSFLLLSQRFVILCVLTHIFREGGTVFVDSAVINPETTEFKICICIGSELFGKLRFILHKPVKLNRCLLDHRMRGDNVFFRRISDLGTDVICHFHRN